MRERRRGGNKVEERFGEDDVAIQREAKKRRRWSIRSRRISARTCRKFLPQVFFVLFLFWSLSPRERSSNLNFEACFGRFLVQFRRTSTFMVL
jgi:hypothetical protein